MCINQQYDSKGILFINEQALINTYNKKGINGSSNVESNFYAEIQHLINTTNNFSNNEWSGIGDLWVALNRYIILSKSNVLYRTNSYDLTKEGIIKYDGRDVYRISFANNSPGVYSTGFGYPAPEKSNGYIYIDKITFAVLRYEHYITRKKYLPKGAKYMEKTTHKIIQSYKKVNGLYFINLLEVNNKTNIYSKDNSLFNTIYDVTSITSQNIETKNVVAIERPLKNIKRGYKYISEDNYWLGRGNSKILGKGKGFN